MHSIRAIISSSNVIQRIADNWIHAELIVLQQGFSMILVIDDLFDDITELVNNKKVLNFEEYFYYFNSSINEFLESESKSCKIAYIETDYFGGNGTQSAMLYEKGKVVIEPRKNAINHVLKELGVVRSKSKDEFESVELEKYRRMD